MNKYHNKKTFYQGRWFDSRAEANYYGQLILLQRAGLIRDLECQVPFVLVPKQTTPSGGTWNATTYRADFAYDDLRDGRHHVVDVKGKRTELYQLKRKLMLFVHGIEVEEVTV